MEFPTKSILRKSGLTFSLVFILIFSIIPFLLHSSFKVGPIYFSLLISLISLIAPYRLRIPYILWINLGKKLGKINSKVILSLFFYLLITPFAILKNIIGFFASILERKDKKDLTSFVFSSDSKTNLTDQY